MTWMRRSLWMLLAASPVAAIGCNPLGAGFLTPVPVQPWVAERMEDKFGHAQRNDNRTPVMPPIRPGYPPPMCEDPPTEREVLRELKRVKRGVPFVCEEFRDNVRIFSERIVDKIDPPRFFPLVGWRNSITATGSARCTGWRRCNPTTRSRPVCRRGESRFCTSTRTTCTCMWATT